MITERLMCTFPDGSQVLVTVWHTLDGVQMEAAKRDHEGDTWGIPTQVVERTVEE